MIFYFMIFYGFPDIFNMMLNFHWISCPFPNDVFQMILAWIFDLEKQLLLYWLCYSREVNHLVISNMRLAILGHSRVTAVRRSEALRAPLWSGLRSLLFCLASEQVVPDQGHLMSRSHRPFHVQLPSSHPIRCS